MIASALMPIIIRRQEKSFPISKTGKYVYPFSCFPLKKR